MHTISITKSDMQPDMVKFSHYMAPGYIINKKRNKLYAGLSLHFESPVA